METTWRTRRAVTSSKTLRGPRFLPLSRIDYILSFKVLTCINYMMFNLLVDPTAKRSVRRGAIVDHIKGSVFRPGWAAPLKFCNPLAEEMIMERVSL